MACSASGGPQRRREIGLRLAVGARRGDVVGQFLIEIVFLGALRDNSERMQFLMPRVTFSPGLALLAFAVLVSAGILAGLVPALRASRLDPAVALREE